MEPGASRRNRSFDPCDSLMFKFHMLRVRDSMLRLDASLANCVLGKQKRTTNIQKQFISG
jgi:hypothetical protein